MLSGRALRGAAVRKSRNASIQQLLREVSRDNALTVCRDVTIDHVEQIFRVGNAAERFHEVDVSGTMVGGDRFDLKAERKWIDMRRPLLRAE